MNHPASCPDPESCTLTYAEHLRSIAVSAHATPTRRPEVVRIDRTDARWSKDHAAYRRLRRDGIQPNHIDGSTDLERAL